MSDRIAQRVALLLQDARWAREHDPGQVEALANAVLALDPGNAEAEALLARAAEPEPGVAAFLAGRFPEAREGAHRALALWITGEPAAACEDPAALALIARLEGDHERALAHARAVGDPAARAVHEGLSRVRLGDPVALDDLEAAVAQRPASDPWSAWWLTELAGAQAHAGRRSAAYESLAGALRVVAATGAGFPLAETLRLRGELRCEDGDEDGLDDLRAAVETARAQGATAFEARAAASLRAAEAYAA